MRREIGRLRHAGELCRINLRLLAGWLRANDLILRDGPAPPDERPELLPVPGPGASKPDQILKPLAGLVDRPPTAPADGGASNQAQPTRPAFPLYRPDADARSGGHFPPEDERG